MEDYVIDLDFVNDNDIPRLTAQIKYVIQAIIHLLKETGPHGMLVNIFHRRDENTTSSLQDQYSLMFRRFTSDSTIHKENYMDSRTGLFTQARALKARILFSYARALLLYIYAAVKKNPRCQPTIYYANTSLNTLDGIKHLWKLVTFFWLEIFQVANYNKKELTEFNSQVDSLLQEHDSSMIIQTKARKSHLRFSTLQMMSLVAEDRAKWPICLELDEDKLRKFAKIGKYKPSTFSFEKNNQTLPKISNHPYFNTSKNSFETQLNHVDNHYDENDETTLKIDLITGLVVPDSFGRKSDLWKNVYRGGFNGSWKLLISINQTERLKCTSDNFKDIYN